MKPPPYLSHITIARKTVSEASGCSQPGKTPSSLPRLSTEGPCPTSVRACPESHAVDGSQWASRASSYIRDTRACARNRRHSHAPPRPRIFPSLCARAWPIRRGPAAGRAPADPQKPRHHRRLLSISIRRGNLSRSQPAMTAPSHGRRAHLLPARWLSRAVPVAPMTPAIESTTWLWRGVRSPQWRHHARRSSIFPPQRRPSPSPYRCCGFCSRAMPPAR